MGRTFTGLTDAGTPFLVVQGSLDFDPALLPVTDLSAPISEGRQLPAVIEGLRLTTEGYSAPFRAEITLDAQCTGPWCASAEPGAPVLAFVTLVDGALVLSVTPCGGNLFQAPSPSEFDRVSACFLGQNCDAEI